MTPQTPQPGHRSADGGQPESEGLFSAERGGRILVRSVIVFSVFPVIAYAFSALVRVPLSLLLAPLAAQGGWDWLPVAIQTLSGLAGVVGSFMVCRLIWPRTVAAQASGANGSGGR